MDNPQRPLLGEQQGQEQQPPTTYARDPLDRALWNCAAYGAMTAVHGRHVTEAQLQHLVDGVLEQHDVIAACDWLNQEVTRLGIVLQGELVGTRLPGGLRQARLRTFVEAVRYGI